MRAAKLEAGPFAVTWTNLQGQFGRICFRLRLLRAHRPEAGTTGTTNENENAFPVDPLNPGWIKGWAVVRKIPWDVAGMFTTRKEVVSR